MKLDNEFLRKFKSFVVIVENGICLVIVVEVDVGDEI
jgi:hypothetical protein